MANAYFDNIEIPGVYVEETTYDVQADAGRTAGGRYRRDAVAVKRVWRIQTRPSPSASIDAVTQRLEDTLFRSAEFWIPAFGSTSVTVTAYIDDDLRSEKVLQAPGRKALSMTVIEA